MRYVLCMLLGLLPLLGKAEEAGVHSAIGNCIMRNQYDKCKEVLPKVEKDIISLEECHIEKKQRETLYIGCMQTGFLLSGADRYEEAIPYLKKGIEIEEDAYAPRYVMHRLGLSYLKLNDMQNARFYLDKACKDGYPFSCIEIKKMQESK